MKKTMILMALMALSALMYGLTVDGYVTDAENGDAIDGATVRFIYLEGTCPGGGSNGSHGSNGGGGGNQGNNGGYGFNVVSTLTDANGYYIITDLVEGIYDAQAGKPGSYPSVRVEALELIEDTSVDFELIGGTCEPPTRSIRKSTSRKL